MTPNNFSNISVATTLVAGIGAGDLSMTVADATGYPAVPFAVVIDVGSVTSEEAVLVTAKTGAVWTISRSYDGTSPHVHSAGASVEHSALARDFRGLILGTREMSTALPTNGNAVVWNNGAVQWEPGAIAASGAAGGVLSGTYPNPGFAVDMATQAELDAAIADLVNTYARLHVANVFTQGPNAFYAGADGNIAYTAQRHSSSATANIVEWQDEAGSALAWLDHDTNAHFPSVNIGANAYFEYDEPGVYAARNYLGEAFSIDTLLFVSEPIVYHNIFNMNVTVDDNSATAMEQAEVYAFSGYIGINGTRTPRSVWGLFAGVDHESSTDMEKLIGTNSDVYTYGGGAITDRMAAFEGYLDNGGGNTVEAGYGLTWRSINESGGSFNKLIAINVPDVIGGISENHAIKTGVGPLHFGDYLESPEIIAPLAPPANTGRTFYRDNGAGKTQYCVRFPTGAIQVIATEP